MIVIRSILIGWLTNLILLIVVSTLPFEWNPSIIIYGQLFFIPVGLAALYWLNKNSARTKLILILISIISLVGIMSYRSFIDWSGEWKTQTILYENLHLSNRTIVFQMQDIGVRGYKRRTVEIIEIFPFLNWVTPFSNQDIDISWKRVDIDVNELGIKSP